MQRAAEDTLSSSFSLSLLLPKVRGRKPETSSSSEACPITSNYELRNFHNLVEGPMENNNEQQCRRDHGRDRVEGTMENNMNNNVEGTMETGGENTLSETPRKKENLIGYITYVSHCVGQTE